MVRYSPWLVMVPNNSISSGKEEKHIKQSFLDVATNLVHTIELPKDACGERKIICGFSLGWLIMFDNQNSSLTLVNPISGLQIDNLPRLPRNGTVHKAILSADPSYNLYDFKVLTIFGEQRELIGYEQEHKQWTMLQDFGPNYDDVAVETEEEFIAVNEMGKLVSCESLICCEHVPPSFFHGNKVYLVSTAGDVFMLVSYSGRSYNFQHETYDDELKRFEVYRYDEGLWRYTINFGGFTVFLGHKHSLAVANAPDFRPNCIYFTDDDGGKIEKSGAFSLEGKAERVQWFTGRSYC